MKSRCDRASRNRCDGSSKNKCDWASRNRRNGASRNRRDRARRNSRDGASKNSHDKASRTRCYSANRKRPHRDHWQFCCWNSLDTFQKLLKHTKVESPSSIATLFYIINAMVKRYLITEELKIPPSNHSRANSCLLLSANTRVAPSPWHKVNNLVTCVDSFIAYLCTLRPEVPLGYYTNRQALGFAKRKSLPTPAHTCCTSEKVPHSLISLHLFFPYL